MIHEDDDVYITRRGEVRFKVQEVEDKKKKKPTGKKSGVSSSPGAKLIKAKQIVGSKASRGFTTKKPVKAHLSYPL